MYCYRFRILLASIFVETVSTVCTPGQYYSGKERMLFSYVVLVSIIQMSER